MNINEMKPGWNFDNSYARLPENFYASMPPTPVREPKIVKLNGELAGALGLDAEMLRSEDGAAVLSGNRLPGGAEPTAQAYAGHQFGYFTMLGDGRAVLLGEHVTPDGKRFDIQLKGSGITPFSRGGDGRAALGPMLREYIISEAMHALGIPTTRSLAVVTTGERVQRETPLIGAVLTRVAASHIRVGTFQYAAKFGSPESLKILADYTLQRHFPEYTSEGNRYLYLLKEIIKRQAALIAKWQLFGFIHGVMNTDNMALSGETIDYGPCAFMDVYDPETVFSSIDQQGRYAYENQPNMAVWNLSRFAETLLPLLHRDRSEAVKLAQGAVSEFPNIYNSNWSAGMRAKLGLITEEPGDNILIKELLDLMQSYKADYTNTFLALTFNKTKDTVLSDKPEFIKWHSRWKARLDRHSGNDKPPLQLMRDSNPAVIPRNHRVEEALYAAVNHGDYGVMERLLEALSKPYAHTPDQLIYSEPLLGSACAYKTFCGT